MIKNTRYNKDVGYQSEKYVIEQYCKAGWKLIAKNYTIRGGEIDGIVENTNTLCFLEVKCVNTITDLHKYLSFKKMSSLKRTILHYLSNNNSRKQKRIDVVFVKENRIYEIFENVPL